VWIRLVFYVCLCNITVWLKFLWVGKLLSTNKL
jgi:hypothetical protein